MSSQAKKREGASSFRAGNQKQGGLQPKEKRGSRFHRRDGGEGLSLSKPGKGKSYHVILGEEGGGEKSKAKERKTFGS